MAAAAPSSGLFAGGPSDHLAGSPPTRASVFALAQQLPPVRAGWVLSGGAGPPAAGAGLLLGIGGQFDGMTVGLRGSRDDALGAVGMTLSIDALVSLALAPTSSGATAAAAGAAAGAAVGVAGTIGSSSTGGGAGAGNAGGTVSPTASTSTVANPFAAPFSPAPPAPPSGGVFAASTYAPLAVGSHGGTVGVRGEVDVLVTSQGRAAFVEKLRLVQELWEIGPPPLYASFFLVLTRNGPPRRKDDDYHRGEEAI